VPSIRRATAGREDAFYAEYGIERDDDRIAFSRLLYDLSS